MGQAAARIGNPGAVFTALGVLLGAASLPASAAAQGAVAPDIAVLQGLDKVTARISSIRAPLGQPVRFGTLIVTVRTCDKAPPEEPPEVAIFVEVHDARQGQAAVLVFSGWMFASSPALSAMEHPVYDVWALDCASSRIEPGGASGPRP
ncbi:MAG: DUF2155 domain-containing protein [Proteobacteria bacterium]|nr:DUF2155 domain-containing protein [Pseudomonadota bacterium]